MSADAPKLGIIAGATDLPRVIAQACEAQGRDYFLLALEDACAPETVDGRPHAWARLGAMGKALTALKEAGVEELVMAGKVHRPKLANLRPDLKATKLLAKLGSSLLKGDDELIRAIISFLEDEGFTVVGVDEVVQELLAPEGPIGTLHRAWHRRAGYRPIGDCAESSGAWRGGD
jgi:DUF1009 family protein